MLSLTLVCILLLVSMLLPERQLRTYPRFLGGFLFFWVTSTHSSTVFGWAWSGSFSLLVSLMVAVETVVAAVSGAAVVAGAFGGSFLGQNGYVPQLLAAPTARTSAFHNHHHLPLSVDNGFRNCLKALPS